jgi:hypothetical protein
VKGAFWQKGVKFPDTVIVPNPLECTLQPLPKNSTTTDFGPDMPEYLSFNAPVFRDDLIAALKEFGVDNIDYYDTLITDPDDGTQYTNYKAANIIGVFNPKQPESKEQPLMARYDVYIVVREDLKENLIKKGFTKAKFYDLGDVALGVAD